MKRAKLECVEAAIQACGHVIRSEVRNKYQQVLEDYEKKCSRQVPEPNLSGKRGVFKHLAGS